MSALGDSSFMIGTGGGKLACITETADEFGVPKRVKDKNTNKER